MGCSPSKPNSIASDNPSQRTQPDDRTKPGAPGSAAPSRPEAVKRTEAILDDVEQVDENYVMPVIPKSEDALARIRAACSDNSLFANIAAEQQEALFLAMQAENANVGDLVIKQGDKGDKWYVIDSGEYDVLLKQKGEDPVHRYMGGGSFGELALMYAVPRASTVRCAVAGSLWSLDRKTFRHAIMSHNKLEVDQTARFLKAVEVLSPLTDEQRAKLAAALEELHFEDGATLWDVGERADWLCLIREGTVVSTSSYREPLSFKVGSFFGTQVRATRDGSAAAYSSLIACSHAMSIRRAAAPQPLPRPARMPLPATRRAHPRRRCCARVRDLALWGQASAAPPLS
jgi:cAMP-dependent protein kinase regulator